MAVSPCCKVLPCSSFFWQKVSNKRQIRDWCIFLLKNAENEKKRLNLASEWRLFDSLGEHEQFTVKKWRNLQPKNRENPRMIFCSILICAKRKCSLNKRKFKSIQKAGFFTSSGETGKIRSWTQKNGELSNQKKGEKFILLVKTEKTQLKKEHREFVQPKKMMKKSPFRMEISAFYWWKPKNRSWKKMEKSAPPKNE